MGTLARRRADEVDVARGEADGIGDSTRSRRLGVSTRVAAALELEIGSGGHEHLVL